MVAVNVFDPCSSTRVQGSLTTTDTSRTPLRYRPLIGRTVPVGGVTVRFTYPVAVDDLEVDEFLQRSAPGDVRDTIAWLSVSGYTLGSHHGEGTFGAQFVYMGEAKVLITVDRSQWMLDVAPSPDAEAWQYDLLIAAQAGQHYGEVFPTVGTRSVGWRVTMSGLPLTRPATNATD